MTSNHNLANLLAAIKRLYSRILALYVKARARPNHNHNNSANSHKIVSSLSECIDKLAAHPLKHSENEAVLQKPVLENHTHAQVPIKHESSSRVEPGELSKFLKKSHRYSGVIQDTGNRLIKSTWEHFHASIRLAHQGDVKKAKLHSELTKNALNEAAHYLSESEYSRFSNDVMNALKNISSHI